MLAGSAARLTDASGPVASLIVTAPTLAVPHQGVAGWLEETVDGLDHDGPLADT